MQLLAYVEYYNTEYIKKKVLSTIKIKKVKTQLKRLFIIVYRTNKSKELKHFVLSYLN